MTHVELPTPKASQETLISLALDTENRCRISLPLDSQGTIFFPMNIGFEFGRALASLFGPLWGSSPC